MQPDVILRRFEQPDEVREMTLGRFEIIHRTDDRAVTRRLD